MPSRVSILSCRAMKS
ncbi:unnamed protein product [Oppiella nova]|uniref:Uncharacterized protein n=1 Tax=Oppiella nova TaxID=334625 RepID=A0A7R9MHJ3_9ACAR|nr:unnamed protein product [Oppiella nova]CAG2177068.1 unnamed protein product [Oppiella nova]